METKEITKGGGFPPSAIIAPEPQKEAPKPEDKAVKGPKEGK
jgi:hypothetical protein